MRPFTLNLKDVDALALITIAEGQRLGQASIAAIQAPSVQYGGGKLEVKFTNLGTQNNETGAWMGLVGFVTEPPRDKPQETFHRVLGMFVRSLSHRVWQMTSLPGAWGTTPLIDRAGTICPNVTITEGTRAVLLPIGNGEIRAVYHPNCAIWFPEGVCLKPEWRIKIWQMAHWVHLGFSVDNRPSLFE